MTVLTEDKANVTAEADVAAADRRRPGRIQNVSAELIPILRNQPPDLTIEFEDLDQSAPIRGLVFAIVLSVPLWIGIGYLGSLLLSP